MISHILATVLLLLPVTDRDDALFNTSMYQDPAAGETDGGGETLAFHEGVGEPPAEGYFKEHEPGEVAEYHLFVPDNLSPKASYPLLIVYHGGKDGASGKGTLRGMSKISTKEHPVIVLSPNMYTMDAYAELLEAGDLPVDPSRVVVFGFSSGGMGVLSAMQEFVRSDGDFRPAVLIAASTTASMGRVTYPQVPYVVMAGEKETPEFVKNSILKNRRSTCRDHSVGMQEVIREVRYLEMRGHGHTSGKPEHHAAIRNLIRALPNAQVKLKVSRIPEALRPLADAARAADWSAVRGEIARLDSDQEWSSKGSYTGLRTKVLRALQSAIKTDVKFITGIGRKSKTWEVLRAFYVHDAVQDALALFADTPCSEKLARTVAPLDRSKAWQAELEARRRYYEIVTEGDLTTMATELQALLAEAADTEFGGNRTREKLLALEG